MNHRNVATFLKINGYYATESEINAIIRRLDVDADSMITYDEFTECMKANIATSTAYIGGISADFEEVKRF